MAESSPSPSLSSRPHSQSCCSSPATWHALLHHTTPPPQSLQPRPARPPAPAPHTPHSLVRCSG